MPKSRRKRNAAELKAIFSPPPPPAGVPTTEDMQKQETLALTVAKLTQAAATIQLSQVKAEQARVEAEINSNPVSASEALRAEAEGLQADAQKLENLLNNEYPDYADNVEAWYLNMTSGSKYVPLDEWPMTQLANYPNLAAVMEKVTV